MVVSSANSRGEGLARRSSEIREFFRNTVAKKAIVSQFLVDAEAEVNRLQTEIYILESKRQHLKATAESYKPLLSPVYHTPSEILTKIFGFCCEDNVLIPSSSPPAVCLSMVCGRWRDIVQSTPSLWSSFTIQFAPWSGKFQSLKQLTDYFMMRSQQSPLSLSLDFSLCERGDGLEFLPILEPIIQACERWSRFDLCLQHRFPLDAFASIRSRLPALRHLRLYPGKASRSEHIAVSEQFDVCPSLRSLELHLLSDEAGSLHFPWPQIKQLHIYSAFSPHGFPLLALCRGVEHLKLTNVGGWSEVDGDYSGHIVTNTIKSLDVFIMEHPGQPDLDDVLRHTTLTGLRSLEIVASPKPSVWSTWDGSHMRDFLCRSSCSLTSLHLHIPFTDLQALSLLRMLPTLESLWIEEYHGVGSNFIVSDTFLDHINASLSSPSATPILPNLIELKLKMHKDKVSFQALLKLLSLRWSPVVVGVVSLGSVEIVVFMGSPNEPEGRRPFDGLQCFKDAGMRLCITYV